MIKKVIGVCIFVASILGLNSCNNTTTSSENELTAVDSLNPNGGLIVSQEAMADVIQNISSPVEMASLIKSTGVEFSQKILNNTDKTADYNTSFKRALNLGVYSADLGYINTFDKNTIVVSYLLAVKDLAEGIKVGQFFDFQSLKRMATNNSNLDSLMEISVSSFNKMDSYLREQNRSNVSSLIVTGAWIEGLYIASNVIESTNNKELTDRIGEQKDIVNILLIILDNYSSDPDFADLAKDMQVLKTLYADVKITTEFGEPKRIEKEGRLIIVQNEISHIEITPEQTEAIIKQIKLIRNKIVA